VLQTAFCDLPFGFAILRHETLQNGVKGVKQPQQFKIWILV
jgi:hypothetical protein